MRLIIAGGRDYELSKADVNKLNQIEGITEVVSGGCCGADKDGESWARSKKIPIKKFEADWNIHGRSAGPKRNAEMAAYADAVVLFKGGSGTRSMFKEATKRSLIIFDWR